MRSLSQLIKIDVVMPDDEIIDVSAPWESDERRAEEGTTAAARDVVNADPEATLCWDLGDADNLDNDALADNVDAFLSTFMRSADTSGAGDNSAAHAASTAMIVDESFSLTLKEMALLTQSDGASSCDWSDMLDPFMPPDADVDPNAAPPGIDALCSSPSAQASHAGPVKDRAEVVSGAAVDHSIQGQSSAEFAVQEKSNDSPVAGCVRNQPSSDSATHTLSSRVDPERQRKLERYRAKKIRRSTIKPTTYASRQRVASSRPRHKGQFVSQPSDFISVVELQKRERARRKRQAEAKQDHATYAV